MTDTYNDTTGSRKKFLIPLVVLLLCAVSLTGAGYAYNSTVTVNDNTTPASDFVIEVYNSAEAATPITAAMTMDKLIVLQHNTTISDASKVVVSAVAGEGFIGKITVNDEVGNDYKVSAAIADGTESKTITVDDTAGEIRYTVNVALYTDAACDDEDLYEDSAVHGNQTFYYKVTVTIDGEHNGITFNGATDSQAKVDLVDAQVLLAKVNLSFSANQVTP